MGSVDVRDANDLVRNVVVNYALGQPDMAWPHTKSMFQLSISLT